MISKKIYIGDGNNKRFLSDFIIRSNQFARPYVFIYDDTLPPDGTGDVLQDGTTDQANHRYPTNLWRRGTNVAKSNDLVTSNYWQVVDNSILYYEAPPADTTVWLEVATTAQEFGDTLVAPSVEAAEQAAAEARASAIAAAASEANAATSEANAAASETAAATSETNAAASETAAATSATNAATSETNAGTSETNAAASAASAAADATRAETAADDAEQIKDDIEGLVPVPTFPADNGKLLTAQDGGNIWTEAPVSLPDATGKNFNELATDGSASDAAEWSPYRLTPNTISNSHIIAAGSNATIGSFTLEDGNTITIEDGGRMIVV